MKQAACIYRPGDEIIRGGVEYYVTRNQSTHTPDGDPVSLIDVIDDDGNAKSFFFPWRHPVEGVVY